MFRNKIYQYKQWGRVSIHLRIYGRHMDGFKNMWVDGQCLQTGK